MYAISCSRGLTPVLGLVMTLATAGASCGQGLPPTQTAPEPPEISLAPPSNSGTTRSAAPAADIDAPKTLSDLSDLKPIPDTARGAHAEDDALSPASEPRPAAADVPVPLMTVDQRIEKLERELARQRELIQRLDAMEQQIVELRRRFNLVARPTGDAPAPTPATAGETAGGEPADDAPQLGRLTINNRTRITYGMTINGVQVSIPPGRRAFNVPVGEVVTELNGFERAKRWQQSDWRELNGRQQMMININ